MRKSFLLKTIFLLVAFAAVLAVIVAIRVNFNSASRAAGAQTFLEEFVVGGGPIVWFVLLPMSLVAVYLSAEHCLSIRRKKLVPDGIGEQIVGTAVCFGAAELESRIANRDDFVSRAVAAAVANGRGDWFRMRNLLFESLQQQASRLARKIEWLSLIGNVSPMVGLFGTVFGMIKLFNAIVTAGGQPQPAQLADGISVALVTTFWGLFIAIPALAIHGVFQNRIETLLSDAVTEAENILPQIKRSLNEQGRPGQTEQKLPINELPAKSRGTTHESVSWKL